jgi:hypothetical protein
LFLRRRVPESGPLKAAVIGAGVFGHHHATKYKALGQAGGDVELFAVADPNAEMRAKAKAHYGCKTVADWRELLGTVDLVSVCSPAVTHAEIVRAFLKAGTHVLVEKPIATTVEESAELVALAREVGKVLTVGHQERFVFARTGLLAVGEVPQEITCWRQGPWTGRGDDVSVVLDLMIHDIDLVHSLVPGAVSEIRAEGPDRIWPACRRSLCAAAFRQWHRRQAGNQPRRHRAQARPARRLCRRRGGNRFPVAHRQEHHPAPPGRAGDWAIRWARRWAVSLPPPRPAPTRW